jgi:hypothetical protein
MRVASIFGRHGFRVIQSDYYTDPRTNAQREIDIYAAMQRNFRTTFIRLAVFAEMQVKHEQTLDRFCFERSNALPTAREWYNDHQLSLGTNGYDPLLREKTSVIYLFFTCQQSQDTV